MGATWLPDIATVIGAVGGAAVVQLFDTLDLFGWYAVGLGVGFFGYLVLVLVFEGKKISGWMGVHGDPATHEGWSRP